MRQEIEDRLRQLARRAGLAGVPSAVIGAGIALCVVAVVFAVWRWWPAEDASPVLTRADAGAETAARHGGGSAGAGRSSGHESNASRTASATTSGAPLCVHVVGAVRHPGLYTLAAGARVNDAVMQAGGVARDGAEDGVNLARPLRDGEQVVIPTREEMKRGTAPSAPEVGTGGTAVGGEAQHGPVDINSADAAALDALPGIGPSTAAKIVADREANGPYASPDDLGRVPGIGPKKLAQLKPDICAN